MLTVELDLARINRAQSGYLETRTRRGAHYANQVRILREAFAHAARRFAERQAAAAAKGAPLLPDASPATLEAVLFGPLATQGWPRRAAAILHGLHLPPAPVLPSVPCCPGGPQWSALDPDSYITRLDDRPPQARSLGDTTSLVVYLAPLRQLRILWIGASSDMLRAKAALRQETDAWSDWRPLAPDYADWLAAACRVAGGAA